MNMSISERKYLIRLEEKPLDISEAYQFLCHENCGAINLFIGTTRKDEITEGKIIGQVESLFYVCYEKMALKMIENIVKETLSKNLEVKKCLVIHRLGLVKVGDASLIIGCSSVSRYQSYDAVMSILNRIKNIVPIWKKINYTESLKSIWSEKSEAFWKTNLK